MSQRNTAPALESLRWLSGGQGVTRFAGGSTVFQFDVLTSDSSIISPDSVIDYDGIFYWMGVDRFLMFNGVVLLSAVRSVFVPEAAAPRLVRAPLAVPDPVPPLATASVPPSVRVPAEVIGPPEDVRPVVPPLMSTDDTVPPLTPTETPSRSKERRVGKEGRSRWSGYDENKSE